jgi:uncharacterized protein
MWTIDGDAIVTIRYTADVATVVTGAEALRNARSRAGLSQAELGERAGVPQSVVSAYERGRRQPSIATLVRLVAAAGFDLDLNLIPRASTSKPFTGPVGRRLQRRREAARRLLEERGYAHPSVFGSVARGSDSTESDIDLLVDLPPGVGLLDLNRAALDLEELIGAPVDLIPRSGVRARVADDIADDLTDL